MDPLYDEPSEYVTGMPEHTLIRLTGGNIHYRIEKCVAEVVQFIEEAK